MTKQKTDIQARDHSSQRIPHEHPNKGITCQSGQTITYHREHKITRRAHIRQRTEIEKEA